MNHKPPSSLSVPAKTPNTAPHRDGRGQSAVSEEALNNTHSESQEASQPFSLEDSNALFDYVRKLSPRRLTILTGLFLAAVAALLVIKMNDEDQNRRAEAELRLARTVQSGADAMNIDIMTGATPGERLGTDLPPGALVSFYHLTSTGTIIASAGRFEEVSLDPLTIATLPLDTNDNLILDFTKNPVAVSWQALDNGEILLATTPARDMFGRQPLWIGYAVLLGAITMLSASLMRAFIRQNAAAHDAAEALTGYIRINDALVNGRCCPWYFNEMTRKVLLSRSLLEPLGLGARDRYFSLQELTTLIHPKDLRSALAVLTGEKKGLSESIARLRRTGGGWSSIMIRTNAEAGRRQRSGIAFDMSGFAQSSNQHSGPPTVSAALGAIAVDDIDNTAALPGQATDSDWHTEQLRDGMDSLPDAFVLWDQNATLLAWNRRFSSLFRFAEGALTVGMSIEDVIKNAGSGQEIIRQYFIPLNGQQRANAEVGLSGDRWVKIIRRQTEAGGLICTAANITEQKRRARAHIKRERQLERTVADLERSRQDLSDTSRNYAYEKRRAEDASRSKSEFLANMSHELRTPLNAINGFSEVMQSELYGPLGNGKYKEYIDDIHASGRHLLELIDDILDMSRIEAGRLQLEPQRIELDRILNESIRLVARRADEAAVTFKASITNAPPIWSDGRAAKQVILNLLANAIKFSGEGGNVSMNTEADLDSVSVIISDNGPGIERNHLHKLGSPFELAENQFARARHGSGLGLALSKSLMELQGGILALSSAPGKGTIACASFPRRDGAKVRLPQFIRQDAHILTSEIPRASKPVTPSSGSPDDQTDPEQTRPTQRNGSSAQAAE